MYGGFIIRLSIDGCTSLTSASDVLINKPVLNFTFIFIFFPYFTFCVTLEFSFSFTFRVTLEFCFTISLSDLCLTFLSQFYCYFHISIFLLNFTFTLTQLSSFFNIYFHSLSNSYFLPQFHFHLLSQYHFHLHTFVFFLSVTLTRSFSLSISLSLSLSHFHFLSRHCCNLSPRIAETQDALHRTSMFV